MLSSWRWRCCLLALLLVGIIPWSLPAEQSSSLNQPLLSLREELLKLKSESGLLRLKINALSLDNESLLLELNASSERISILETKLRESGSEISALLISLNEQSETLQNQGMRLTDLTGSLTGLSLSWTLYSQEAEAVIRSEVLARRSAEARLLVTRRLARFGIPAALLVGFVGGYYVATN